MKNILLLGGTGAIGNFVAEILSNSDEWNIFITTRNERIPKIKNVKYIKGNAREFDFIKNVCIDHYDAIIDFMNYNLEEFEQNYEVLLRATNHYIFLSSCRVYNNENLLTENSPRLLDTIKDDEFLKTNRYALRKAREEDILNKSEYNNWTIVRPYITFSNIRLQLGVYEKEEWLYRLLNDEPLVVNKNVLEKYTSLTYGYDVAYGIYKILNNKELYRDKIQFVTEQSIIWKDILNTYTEIITNLTNKNPVIIESENLCEIEELFEGGYNTKYDRLWNRKFDNSKSIEYSKDIVYHETLEKIKECLIEFIEKWKIEGNIAFNKINEEYENKMNILCNKLMLKENRND